MSKAGRVLGGKYRLEQLLGRGGMGSVWLARHLQLGCAVAVKVVESRRPDGADIRARFEREARAVAQLRSPHVAQIHDQGADGSTIYMVMELLDGEDLGARLRLVGRLTLREVAGILTQTARVLRLAHEAGIVHRDLKPSNVFLARAHDEEMVKVLDFGIAKSVFDTSSPDLTTTGALLGTLHYMSPEQLRDPRAADWRSDLWSLGVIAFRAATGREPFAGKVFGETVGKICKDALPLATDAALDLPRELDAFFERAFARDREQRFQSAREMAERFSEIALASERDEDAVPTQLFDGRFGAPWTPEPSGTSDSARVIMRAFVPPPLPSGVGPPIPPAPSVEAALPGASRWPRLDTPVPPSCAPMALPARYDSSWPPSHAVVAVEPVATATTTAAPARSRRGAGWAATAASVLTVAALALLVSEGRLPFVDAAGPTSGASGEPSASLSADEEPTVEPPPLVPPPATPATPATDLPQGSPPATSASGAPSNTGAPSPSASASASASAHSRVNSASSGAPTPLLR